MRKRYISPEYLSRKVMTDIEKERQETIRKNLVELDAAGIDYSTMKSMAAKLFGPKQQSNHKSSKEVKNKAGHGAGDEEYLPPEGLDYEHSYGSMDDETSRSHTKKIHASLKCRQSLIGNYIFQAITFHSLVNYISSNRFWV
ncbi:hypothetical protein Dimus_038015 [Dionaea muscipula]